jgi:hypothetical protein
MGAREGPVGQPLFGVCTATKVMRSRMETKVRDRGEEDDKDEDKDEDIPGWLGRERGRPRCGAYSAGGVEMVWAAQRKRKPRKQDRKDKVEAAAPSVWPWRRWPMRHMTHMAGMDLADRRGKGKC